MNEIVEDLEAKQGAVRAADGSNRRDALTLTSESALKRNWPVTLYPHLWFTAARVGRLRMRGLQTARQPL